MDNALIWILFMIFDLSMVILAYKLFGKIGLYGMITMSIIVANLQVLKLVEIFGITITLGNIIYGSIFLSTDLLSEFYGKKEAKKGVWLGFFVLVITTVYMQIALSFTPSADDFAHTHMVGLFSFLPRVVLGSLVAYLLSQQHDVWLYNLLKKRFNDKHLWLRNNMSTWISQLIDSLVFCSIAFFGIFSTSVFLQILITTYVFKLIVAIVDTPFIYFAKYVLGKQT